MRRILIFLLFLGIFSFSFYAQNDIQIVPKNELAANDTSTNYGWSADGVVGLNLSQVAFSNWSQGGENSIAFSLFGEFGFIYRTIDWKLDNYLKVSYGQNKLGDQEFRITDNELYLESVLSYDVGWVIKPFVANLVRTVISNGYEYGDTSKTQISAFFDPGYVTQTIGFMYDNNKNFKSRLGIGLQETFTSKFNSYSDDPETPNKIEDFRFDAGIESVTDYEAVLDDNLKYVTKLRLFGRFEDLSWWDVRWDNILTAKVTDYLNVNLNVLVVYEKLQTPKTQLKQALQLGFTYTLF